MESSKLTYQDRVAAVRLARLIAGLSQAQLAEKVTTTQPSISYLENGSRHSPRLLYRVEATLGLHKSSRVCPMCQRPVSGQHI